MAILAPAELPSVLKVRSEPMKKYVLSKLGYPIRDLDLDLAAGVLGTASYCSVYDSICTYTTAMMDANDGTNINAGGTNTGWDFGSAIPVFMNYYMQQGMV